MTELANITEIAPPNLTCWIHPWSLHVKG